MSGNAVAGAARGLPRRAARQGRDRRGARRPGRRHAAARRPDRGARALRSTSSAPAATGRTHGQHLHDGVARRRRRRARGWSSTATARRRPRPARPTCWRRSASGWTCTPARVAELATEVGITFCFAQVFHPAMRHAGRSRAGARRADGVQLPRPADQPGAAAGGGGRRRGRADGAAHRRRARRARRVGAGVPRRRRARRALDDVPRPGVGGARRRGRHAPARPARPRPRRPRRSRTSAAATPRTTRPSSARVLAGEPGPVRDTVLLNAAAALVAADAAEAEPATATLEDRLAGRAGARAPPAVDSGAAAEVLDRWVAATRVAATGPRAGSRVVQAEVERGLEVVAASTAGTRGRCGSAGRRRPC